MYYIYIATNKNNTALYTGITNDLVKRVQQHKSSIIDGFTKKYNCTKLVWYEETSDITSAIQREKRIKRWKRDYKISLIERLNPDWIDLYYRIKSY